MKLHVAFQLAYLHLTLAYCKGRGQGHARFDCEYLANVNVNVNICNALEFPKEQKCRYLLWSIEGKMVQVCCELRSE